MKQIDFLLLILILVCCPISTISKTCTVLVHPSQWRDAAAAAAAAARAIGLAAVPVVAAVAALVADESQPPVSLFPRDTQRHDPADRFDTCSCDHNSDRRVCSDLLRVADAPQSIVTNRAWQLQASSANYHVGDCLCTQMMVTCVQVF